MDGGGCRRQQHPVDRGWAWVVLAASLGSHYLAGVLVYSVGVLHSGLLARFHSESLTLVALTGAVNTGLVCLTAPIAGYIINRYGCRTCCVLGGLLCFAGYTSSAFVTSVVLLFFTFGLTAGAGVGLVYSATNVTIGFYFDAKRGLASGISNSFQAVGILSGSVILQAMVDTYSISGTFLLLGATSLHFCFFGMFYRPTIYEGKAETLELDIAAVGEHKTESIEMQADLVVDNNSMEKKDRRLLANKLTAPEGPRINGTPTESERSLKEKEIEVCREEVCEELANGGKKITRSSERYLITVLNTDLHEKAQLLDVLDDADVLDDGGDDDDDDHKSTLGTPPSSRHCTVDKDLAFQPDPESGADYTNPDGDNPDVEKDPLKPECESDCVNPEAEGETDPWTPGDEEDSLDPEFEADPLNPECETLPFNPVCKTDSLNPGGRPGPLNHRELEQADNGSSFTVQATDKKRPTDSQTTIENRRKKKKKKKKKQQHTVRGSYMALLTDTAFMLHCVSLFVSNVNIAGVFLHLPQYVQQHGTPTAKAAELFLAVGCMSLVSKLACGFATTDPGIDPLILSVGMMGLNGGITCLFPLFADAFSKQMVFSALFGLYFGGLYALINPILVRFAGVSRLADAYGISMFLLGGGCLMGPTLAAMIVDAGGTYGLSFLFLGIMMLSGSFLDMAAACFLQSRDRRGRVPAGS